MHIEYLYENDAPERWDAYVGIRASTVTDLFAWRRVVRDAYGIASHFLTAIDNGHLVGTLSLYEIKHPVFGHYLTTAVFGTDGGLHYDSDSAREALVDEATALALRLGVAYLAIRSRVSELPGFLPDPRYRTAVIDLEGTPELLLKRLPVKTRNQMRRGMKEGFTVTTGADQLPSFYDVFHQHMRHLGSPAHSLRFYQAIMRHLGDRAELFVVRDGSALVAGALFFWVNGTAMNHHTVALRQYNARCPNYLLYWRMIEASYARGLHTFDMGRSEAGSSQLQFKRNWGAREVELNYNYFLAPDREPPQISHNNAKYRLAIACWRRLPLLVTRALGPHIISGIA
jgi:serine/alanine adding enzyme